MLQVSYCFALIQELPIPEFRPKSERGLDRCHDSFYTIFLDATRPTIMGRTTRTAKELDAKKANNHGLTLEISRRELLHLDLEISGVKHPISR